MMAVKNCCIELLPEDSVESTANRSSGFACLVEIEAHEDLGGSYEAAMNEHIA